MRWARHAAIWGTRSAYRVLEGDLMESDHFQDLGVDGRILKMTFNEWDGETWAGLVWLRMVTEGEHF